MAQSTDNDQLFQDDSSQNDEGKSMFSKLKDKTKEHGKKLKTKIQGLNNSDSGATNNDESEETEGEDVPVHNAAPAGETQPLGTDVGSYDQKPADTSSPTPDDETAAAVQPNEDEAAARPNEDEEGLTKSFQGLSTNEQSGPEKMETTPGPEGTDDVDSGKPVTNQVSDGLTSATDQTKETILGGDNSDAPPVTEQAGQQAQQLGDKASETGKTWSQWAAQKVGYAKDTVNANAPKTAEGKPYHQHAYDTVVGAKNSLAAHTDPNQMPSDPAQHTYVQKAAVGIYGAKDSLFSATQPGEHDKALSQQVTDTVGNLPATIKSSLGFKGKTGSPSTTTTASGSSPTEEAPGAAPQSPSIVSRFTGLFGAKKPPTEETVPSSEAAAPAPAPETAAEPEATSTPS